MNETSIYISRLYVQKTKPTALAVYDYITYFSDNRLICPYTVVFIAKDMDWKRSTVSRSVSWLIDSGLLRRIKPRGTGQSYLQANTSLSLIDSKNEDRWTSPVTFVPTDWIERLEGTNSYLPTMITLNIR